MMRSGLSSNRGMQQSGTPDVGSGGTGSLTGIPGSRNGLGTPVITVAISPNPSVGATDVSDAACIRIASNRSSWSFGPAGSRSAAVSTTAAGSGRAVAVTVTSPGSELSTWVKLKNSLTVPRAVTWLPTATAGVAKVNTKMPSDVAGLASASASVACRKKPFDLIPVTRPVVNDVRPGKRRHSAAALDVVDGRRDRRAAPRRRRRVTRQRVADREIHVVVVGVEAAAALANGRSRIARSSRRGHCLQNTWLLRRSRRGPQCHSKGTALRSARSSPAARPCPPLRPSQSYRSRQAAAARPCRPIPAAS